MKMNALRDEALAGPRFAREQMCLVRATVSIILKTPSIDSLRPMMFE